VVQGRLLLKTLDDGTLLKSISYRVMKVKQKKHIIGKIETKSIWSNVLQEY